MAVDPEPDVARGLRDATDGWPAALVMAISTIAKADDQPTAAASVITRNTAPVALLGDLLLDLGETERTTLIQLSHLPMISPAIADLIAGREGTFEGLVAAGAPLAPTAGGWWELPEPVVEHLVRHERLRPEAARHEARAYAAAGEYGIALQTLIAGGDPDRAAELLASLAPQTVEELGARDVAEVVTSLSRDVTARHPRVLSSCREHRLVEEDSQDSDRRAEQARQEDPVVHEDRRHQPFGQAGDSAHQPGPDHLRAAGVGV